MKNILVAFCFLILLFPSWSHAEDLNAGFVQGLWYSSETVFADTPTRIYVAFRNNTPNDLTGTIRFTDNEKRIGTASVSALSGRLVEAWVDWSPTYGEHKLVVTLSNAEVHVIGEGSKPATLTDITVEETLTVDYDTDTDGIGNTTDTDDDNDGVSDNDERTRGSDPLVSNPATNTIDPVDEKPEAEKEKKTTEESASQPITTTQERGLERFVPEGTLDNVLTHVTGQIGETKQSLDTYRKERNGKPDETTVEEVVSTSTMITSGASFDTATITRTKIETEEGLLSAFVTSVATLFHKMGTFLLWILSHALAYPALMQFLLLILILYMFYRIARRIGRRPN